MGVTLGQTSNVGISGAEVLVNEGTADVTVEEMLSVVDGNLKQPNFRYGEYLL